MNPVTSIQFFFIINFNITFLSLCIQNRLFLSVFPSIVGMFLSPLLCLLRNKPILPSFRRSYHSTQCRTQLIKFVTMLLSPTPVNFLLLRLTHLISNLFFPCCAKIWAFCPLKTAGKITVLQILISAFLDIRHEGKRLRAELQVLKSPCPYSFHDYSFFICCCCCQITELHEFIFKRMY